MELYIITVIVLFLFILFLFQKIERQKVKIISLSRQNSKLLNTIESRKNNNKLISNISKTEIKFMDVSVQNAFLKNTSHIKIAPFDFAPKIVDIKKNTEVTIISKILIAGEYWYEILVNNKNLSYKLKGWVKDCGIDFIYKTKPMFIKKEGDIF